jgi:hypothetical protein
VIGEAYVGMPIRIRIESDDPIIHGMRYPFKESVDFTWWHELQVRGPDGQALPRRKHDSWAPLKRWRRISSRRMTSRWRAP